MRKHRGILEYLGFPGLKSVFTKNRWIKRPSDSLEIQMTFVILEVDQSPSVSARSRDCKLYHPRPHAFLGRFNPGVLESPALNSSKHHFLTMMWWPCNISVFFFLLGNRKLPLANDKLNPERSWGWFQNASLTSVLWALCLQWEPNLQIALLPQQRRHLIMQRDTLEEYWAGSKVMFWSCVFHQLAVWLWADILTSLVLSFILSERIKLQTVPDLGWFDFYDGAESNRHSMETVLQILKCDLFPGPIHVLPHLAAMQWWG